MRNNNYATLYAFAICLQSGFEVWNDYREYLNQCIAVDTGNDLLLDLFFEGNAETSVHLILTEIDFENCGKQTFQKSLISVLQSAYRHYDIAEFARKLYCLWTNLPRSIQFMEPFSALTYIDDSLAWGDVESCQNAIERFIYNKLESQ